MWLQLGGHPLFQRLASLRNARVFSRGKEVADDLRERWETSESPLVHRIQARPQIYPSILPWNPPLAFKSDPALQCGFSMWSLRRLADTPEQL